MSPFTAIYRLVLRRLLTRTRAAAFGLVGVAMIVVGILINRNAANPIRTSIEVVASLGLLLVVPLVCLVIATPAIGEWVEDETLVYVWLRPIPRSTLAIAPLLAALTVALPVNIVTTGLLAAVGSGLKSVVIGGAFVASVVATIAYCAVFVLLGAWSKRALVAGFGYVFVWEGLVAQYGPGLARLSIRSYAVSTLALRTGTRLPLDGRAGVSAVIMVIVVTIAGIALTTRILQRKDVP